MPDTTGYLASNIDCKKGVVNIYDSLFTSLNEETLATVNSYFGEKGSKCKVQYRSRSKLGLVRLPDEEKACTISFNLMNIII